MGRLENAKTFEFEIISNSSVDCMVSVGNLAILLNKLISVQPYVKTLKPYVIKDNSKLMCNYQNRLLYFIALSKLWIAWSLMGYLFEKWMLGER